jgi:two-component sensor histidine kinase
MISVKDATIREIHHRVKNNLQTIASLLRLQGRRVSSDEARLVLQESVMRVGSIALVHETLSEQPQDVAEFGDVASRICRMVSDGLVSPDAQIEIKMSGRTGPLGADLATPLAVSVTELIQNSIEHAFPETRSGTIGVDLASEETAIVVTVWDDGVGLVDDPAKSTKLGLQIVRSLIGELGGTFSQSVNGGTRSEIRVPTR